MSLAANVIIDFYHQTPKFYTNRAGIAMVEIFNVHSYDFKDHEVMVLAKEILAHKRSMNRIRKAIRKSEEDA